MEYDVWVHQKRPFQGGGDRRKIVRRINLLIVALSFCTRFVGCAKADELFAAHSISIRTVYAVACVFRSMFHVFRENKHTLPSTDKDKAWGEDRRTLETLILDFVPCFVRTQGNLLNTSVQGLTEKEFDALHHPLDVTEERAEAIGGDLLIRGGEESSHGGDEVEDDDEVDDDEIAALEHINFCD